MKLHGFSRSTASWRVRIALGLKDLTVEQQSYRLRNKDQHTDAYRKLNPQLLVPSLELDDGRVLTQSLAIIEYLDVLYPTPPLLPDDPFEKAQVRAVAQIVACDIHPVQNLKILQRVSALAEDESAATAWAATTIREGLESVEAIIATNKGTFCFGDNPTLADICLIPQIGNAQRFGVELIWPRINEIVEACKQIPAFVNATPENQADAL